MFLRVNKRFSDIEKEKSHSYLQENLTFRNFTTYRRNVSNIMQILLETPSDQSNYELLESI